MVAISRISNAIKAIEAHAIAPMRWSDERRRKFPKILVDSTRNLISALSSAHRQWAERELRPTLTLIINSYQSLIAWEPLSPDSGRGKQTEIPISDHYLSSSFGFNTFQLSLGYIALQTNCYSMLFYGRYQSYVCFVCRLWQRFSEN